MAVAEIVAAAVVDVVVAAVALQHLPVCHVFGIDSSNARDDDEIRQVSSKPLPFVLILPFLASSIPP